MDRKRVRKRKQTRKQPARQPTLNISTSRHTMMKMSPLERASIERSKTKERMEHLASFPELNPNPVIEVDSVGKITYRNTATIETLKTLGLEDNPNVFLPRDINEILNDLKQKKKKKKKKSEFYREVQVGDAIFGETFHYTANFDAIRIYTIDITERKRAEETVSRLAAIVESSNDAIIGRTPDMTITSWNKAAEKIFGYTEEEMIGKTLFIPAPAGYDNSKQTREKVQRGERVEHYETKRIRKDGKIIDVSLTFSPVKSSTGEIVGTSQTARDITERKLAEEKLKKSHDQYMMLLEASRDAVSVAVGPRLVYVNKRYAEMLGFSDPSELLGRDSLEFVASEERELLRDRALQRERGENVPEVYEFTIIRKDGVRVPVEVNAVRIEWEGAGATLSFRRDITERKQMENELKENIVRNSMLAAILEQFTRSIDVKEILKESVKVIKDYTRCSSVGIRLLDEDGNIPYEAYVGFPTKFYESESPLSIKSDKCMCINVIKGDYAPSKPFYTASGSFYSNGTSKLLATVSEEEKGKTRNVCNQTGYESVSLTPIRINDKIIGLIHLADEKENMVPLPKVQFMEKVATRISLGIEKARINAKLKESEKQLKRYTAHLEESVEQRTKELGESEEKFRGFAERSFDIVAMLELDGVISYVSPVVVLLTGYSPEEMIGKSVQSYLSEWSIPNAIRGLARVAKGEIAKAEELEFVRKDGSIIHVEVNASPVFKGNRIVGVQIIVRDVLEKFKLGEVIDLARQYAENIVSTVRDPLVVLDSDLRIISANPSFYENFKVKSTETEGKSLYEIGDRQWDNPELRRLLTEILPAKSVITDFELTHTFPTIGRRVMLLNARKVQAEVGREPFILLAIEDITERKRQEKTLRDSEEKYRVIVERSWDAVVTFDAKGRISYASPSLLLITGHSPAEVEGKTLDNFLHKADVPKYIQYIKGVLQGEVFESHEMKIVKSDGAIGYAEINSSPIFDESGLVTGVQAILRDVSERHKLAEIKDRFISAVTHELRTPLVSIQGYLDLILSESGIVGQTKMDLETVKRNTNILSQLVDDLLDVQRLASGRMPLDLQPLNLQTLIQDCIQQVQPLITEKNHNLQLETPESEVTVVGDKTILTDESW